ncbi:MmgE/PrpD family protein [Paraburkholderia sp. BCC1884]|uniref:MmgE/PrpD family protein n=1 Tax=Paraburkholderia sp. BCC1884 TaxID=2562668 RepID=UPI001182B32A|nr:MmgE/PrpD family protein [Paraburkholderia sp. BCC1884]
MSHQESLPVQAETAGTVAGEQQVSSLQQGKQTTDRPDQDGAPGALPGPTEALARFAAGLKWEMLNASVIERTKDLVLDHLGVALYGTQLPWTMKVRDFVLSEGGCEQSTIYGSHRVPARAAALVNGAAAHAIELDDTHDESLSHPGSVILPAAFAMAEALDRRGTDFLTAVVAAYDVHGRIGAALGNDLLRRGFHPPCVGGVYGAVTAAGLLLNLDAATLVSAYGSGASMNGGTMQFTEDPTGTMIKRLHTGLPAERGILAAKLAADGFLGPKEAIEGRYGFAKQFAGRSGDLERMTQEANGRFEIERMSIKLYACCKLFHSMIEAMMNCRAERPFTAEEIVTIEPFGPRFMIDTHMVYRPESTMAAQYSLPYTCAAVILLDPTHPDSFAETTIGRTDVLRLADRVKPVIDPELESLFPRKIPGGVRIRLRNGEQLTSTVIEPRSSPDRPIGREDVQAKFRSLTTGVLPAQRQQQIIDMVANLERLGSIRELTSLLSDQRDAR